MTNYLFLELRIIAANIRLSSWASFHNTLAVSFISGKVCAIILNQYFVSFVSFLAIAILFIKSFLEFASSAFYPVR